MSVDPTDTHLRAFARALAYYQARVGGLPRVADEEVVTPFEDAFFLPPGDVRDRRNPRRRMVRGPGDRSGPDGRGASSNPRHPPRGS